MFAEIIFVPNGLIVSFAVWISLAPVLTPRQEVAVAEAGGRIYLIGGIAADHSILASVEEYDPSTNRWRFVAPLPRPRHHAAAVGIGELVYVIGGFGSVAFDPQDSVYRYDTVRNEWSEVAPLPEVRAALAAVSIDGRIYAVGGVPDTQALAMYEPATDVWTPLAPMPTGREHLAAAAVNGRLYVAGGRVGGNVNAFERYEPASNTWTALDPLPTARSGLAAAAIGSRIYVFGGEGNPNTATGVFEEVESFDTISGRWRREVPMAVPRHGIGAAAIGDRIHIPGGAPVQGFGTTDAHDAIETQFARRRSVR
jgi:N-acetylneuraminic acid mutarotase